MRRQCACISQTTCTGFLGAQAPMSEGDGADGRTVGPRACFVDVAGPRGDGQDARRGGTSVCLLQWQLAGFQVGGAPPVSMSALQSCSTRNGMSKRPLRILATVLLAWVTASAGVASERESFELRVPVAPASVMVEGRAHLGYELHLTNFSRQPLLPQAIVVLDDATGRPIATFADQQLSDRMAAAVPGAAAAAIAPDARSIVYVDLAFTAPQIRAALRHQISYRVADGVGEVLWRVDGGVISVDARPASVIGAPLRGGPWAAVFHPDWPRGHRRVFYAVEGRATAGTIRDRFRQAR